MKRPKGYMEMRVLHRVLNEAAKYKTPIRFIRWGEPTLYPRLIEAVKECHKRGLMCHINTNGLLMDANLFLDLYDAGLNSLKFSLQGVTPQGYCEMRACDQFYSILEKVRICHDLRTQRGGRHPFIQIGTTVTNETLNEIDTFIESVGRYTDAVYVGKTRDLTTTNDPKAACQCPEVWDKLSVNWDGTVSACCGDYDNLMPVGDINNNRLAEMWFNLTMEYYRMTLAEYKHYKLPLCSKCARSIVQ